MPASGQIVVSYQLIFEPVKGHHVVWCTRSGGPCQERIRKRGGHREEGVRKGLASPINNHGRSRWRRAAVAAKDLLPLLELGPALFEGGSIGVQTLVKYRVIL